MAVLASHNPEDAYKNDYHGHPKYIIVFVVQLIALGLWLGLPYIMKDNHGMVVIITVLTALVTGVLLTGMFMHLFYEPKLISGLMGFSVFAVVAFYFGTMPDVNKSFDDFHGKDKDGNAIKVDISKNIYPEFNTYTQVKPDAHNSDSPSNIGMVRGEEYMDVKGGKLGEKIEGLKHKVHPH